MPKQTLKTLTTQLKKLQSELATVANNQISIAIKTNQARFERVHVPGVRDTGVGEFYLELSITAPNSDVYIPNSIASGKTLVGFMYQIEGTGDASISTANVKWRGAGITEVLLGTLVYVKVPATKTAIFVLQISIKGSIGKSYKIVINRINYKLQPTDARYIRYSPEIQSTAVVFS
jgi:hypothetical protein